MGLKWDCNGSGTVGNELNLIPEKLHRKFGLKPGTFKNEDYVK